MERQSRPLVRERDRYENLKRVQTWLAKLPVPCGGRLGIKQLGPLSVLAACLFGMANVQAADQTWSTAPADANWVNTNNWVGQAALGAGGVQHL